MAGSVGVFGEVERRCEVKYQLHGYTIFALNAVGTNRIWATVYGGRDDAGNRVADAEVIVEARKLAAALDLYAACKRTLEILDAWGPERRGDTLERLHERIKAALAKADGEA